MCAWCVLRRVWLCNLMDCSPPGPFVYGISQARILEWVTISSSRGSSRPRNQTWVSCVSCTDRQILYHWAIWEAQHTHTSMSMFNWHFAVQLKLMQHCKSTILLLKKQIKYQLQTKGLICSSSVMSSCGAHCNYFKIISVLELLICCMMRPDSLKTQANF